jgi:hypothetical protein
MSRPARSRGPTGLGGVAQLGERLLCKQEVDGSSPFTSTIPNEHHVQTGHHV